MKPSRSRDYSGGELATVVGTPASNALLASSRLPKGRRRDHSPLRDFRRAISHTAVSGQGQRRVAEKPQSTPIQ
jgi:hypothetical protein